MQILPIRQILIRSDIGVISIIPLGIFLVSPLVGDNKSESKQEDYHDLLVSLVTIDSQKTYFGNSRYHANDDTGRIGRRFCKCVSTDISPLGVRLTRFDESIWSDDVADCNTYKDDGTSDNFFCGSANIPSHK